MGNEQSMGDEKTGRRKAHLKAPNSASPAFRQRRLSNASRIDEATSKFNETGDFGLSLAETLSLSTYQQQLLMQTWPRVVKAYSTSDGPVAVFQGLGCRNPNAKNLFQRVTIVDGFTPTKAVDIREHGRLLGELFQTAIKGLNSSALDIREKCAEIGVVHTGLSGKGMTPRMWEDLGDCLIDFVCKADCVRKSRETAKAWTALVSFLIDNMKSGYQTELRRRVSSSPRVEKPSEELTEDFSQASSESRRRGSEFQGASGRNNGAPHSGLQGPRRYSHHPQSTPSPNLRRSYNDVNYTTQYDPTPPERRYSCNPGERSQLPEPPVGLPFNGLLSPSDERGYYEEQMYRQQRNY